MLVIVMLVPQFNLRVHPRRVLESRRRLFLLTAFPATVFTCTFPLTLGALDGKDS